jgi:hypothetical protein
MHIYYAERNNMELKNCSTCHRVFQYPGYGYILCPECRRTDEAQFQLVKKFLDQYPGAEGKEVFLATGVPINTLIKWVREGRLVSSNAVNLGAVCDICGKPVCTGKLCPECKKDIVKQFKESEAEDIEKVEKIIPKSHDKGMKFLH